MTNFNKAEITVMLPSLIITQLFSGNVKYKEQFEELNQGRRNY